MMKTFGQRILALALCVTLALGLCSGALATSAEGNPGTNPIGTHGDDPVGTHGDDPVGDFTVMPGGPLGGDPVADLGGAPIGDPVGDLTGTPIGDLTVTPGGDPIGTPGLDPVGVPDSDELTGVINPVPGGDNTERLDELDNSIHRDMLSGLENATFETDEECQLLLTLVREWKRYGGVNITEEGYRGKNWTDEETAKMRAILTRALGVTTSDGRSRLHVWLEWYGEKIGLTDAEITSLMDWLKGDLSTNGVLRTEDGQEQTYLDVLVKLTGLILEGETGDPIGTPSGDLVSGASGIWSIRLTLRKNADYARAIPQPYSKEASYRLNGMILLPHINHTSGNIMFSTGTLKALSKAMQLVEENPDLKAAIVINQNHLKWSNNDYAEKYGSTVNLSSRNVNPYDMKGSSITLEADGKPVGSIGIKNVLPAIDPNSEYKEMEPTFVIPAAPSGDLPVTPDGGLIIDPTMPVVVPGGVD